MAASFGTATASATENALKSSPYLPLSRRPLLSSSSKVSFRLSHKSKLRFSSKSLQYGWKCSAEVRAQLNEVAVGGSANAAATTPVKSEISSAAKDVKNSVESPPPTLASEESLSEFFTQVASLVKLVDSKDIVELQLKQLDSEVLIRKKEAFPPPPSAPVTMVNSHTQPAKLPPVLAPSPLLTHAPSAAPTPAPSPKTQTSESSLPPLKCPMAGTFYRSPGPGEPPFVKVGDKVQRGQVLCIIEAMKLMNEIEADQSGTIVEILAEDGKPVSVDTPLFVIKP
ncbi:biotin carboxyl carrier of acetyl- carboxylase, chloroplastic-like [Olea europaea subsp. europaea]|uniref:Biotin carboxyl carrier protein of acetyl-CoA carboxylase n=1 Tax=Olea europaea subsp. europaea TaxID=158383 RepID=A0A8S0V5P8_OLEEU|nr:biotin carboxyl carrier of acetyl- carboxylase, chloroplastic-like [Olea europaea subsp. europaea]